MTTTFDPVAFKATTRRRWQEAADAWHGWGPFIGEWLGEATEAMIEMAHVQEGSAVLDVAAGAGEQSRRKGWTRSRRSSSTARRSRRSSPPPSTPSSAGWA